MLIETPGMRCVITLQLERKLTITEASGCMQICGIIQRRHYKAELMVALKVIKDSLFTSFNKH